MRAFKSIVWLSSVLSILCLMAGCQTTSGWSMNKSGMAKYKRGNYAMARQSFQRAVIDSPNNPDYRHNLAMACQKQGDPQQAELILRHNLTVDPMHQPTYHALAQVLVSQQRTAEAQQLLTEWRDTQPYVPETYIEYAWLQRELGNPAVAEQSLQQALQVKRNHRVALAQLGQLYHETGRTDQAAAYYQRSLQSRWGQPEVQSRLATVAGDSGSGRRLRRSALAQNPVMMPPMMTSQTSMYSGPQFVSYNASAAGPMNGAMMVQQPMVVEQSDSSGARRSRRNRTRDRDALPVYPLPDYGFSDPSWASGNSLMTMSAPSLPSPMFGSPTPLPESPITAVPSMDSSSVISGPTLIPQADPAHAPESTAGLPVVDPY